mgnify:CR=1 FL=1
MPQRHVTITADHGAHARPVAELVRIARTHHETVMLRTPSGATVDLGSVLALMDLALAPGDEVVLETAETAGADGILDEMAAILAPAP